MEDKTESILEIDCLGLPFSLAPDYDLGKVI